MEFKGWDSFSLCQAPISQHESNSVGFLQCKTM